MTYEKGCTVYKSNDKILSIIGIRVLDKMIYFWDYIYIECRKPQYIQDSQKSKWFFPCAKSSLKGCAAKYGHWYYLL